MNWIQDPNPWYNYTCFPPDLSQRLFLCLFCFDQFDHTFVEVHRVRRFRFTPRHCQSDSDLELDLRENGKRQIFSQICRDHPACGCAPAYSSWNCDGEILNHAAIDVRYHNPLRVSYFVLSTILANIKQICFLKFSFVFSPEYTASWSNSLQEGSKNQPFSRISPTPVQCRHTPSLSDTGVILFQSCEHSGVTGVFDLDLSTYRPLVLPVAGFCFHWAQYTWIRSNLNIFFFPFSQICLDLADVFQSDLSLSCCFFDSVLSWVLHRYVLSVCFCIYSAHQ